MEKQEHKNKKQYDDLKEKWSIKENELIKAIGETNNQPLMEALTEWQEIRNNLNQLVIDQQNEMKKTVDKYIKEAQDELPITEKIIEEILLITEPVKFSEDGQRILENEMEKIAQWMKRKAVSIIARLKLGWDKDKLVILELQDEVFILKKQIKNPDKILSMKEIMHELRLKAQNELLNDNTTKP